MTHIVDRSTPELQANETRTSRRLRRLPFLIVGMMAAGAVAWGADLHRRLDAQAAETQRGTADFQPIVHVVTAKVGVGAITLTLPGSTVAFEQARIFARATGFVAERRVDIGSRVHAGDILARIAAPDLDQQLKQAEATLSQREAALKQADAAVIQAASNKDLASVTDGRISKLARQGWATLQNADQTRLGLAAQSATLTSAEANASAARADRQAQIATLQRLHELAGFEQVTAPFDGVVTERNIDAGDLISGSASGGTGMFVLQRDDVLRVHVDVPQSAAVGLRDGLEAEIVVPEEPDEVFHGVVARNAASLNVASRTLSAEVDVPNVSHALHAGLFVNVTVSVPRLTPNVVVPASAILFNGQGLRVAVVAMDGIVSMHDVSIHRDFGTSVELLIGLKGGERVAVSPPANLQDGAKVRVVEPAPSTTAAVDGPAIVLKRAKLD